MVLEFEMDVVRLCKSINHTWKNGVQNTTDLPSKKVTRTHGSLFQLSCRIYQAACQFWRFPVFWFPFMFGLIVSHSCSCIISRTLTTWSMPEAQNVHMKWHEKCKNDNEKITQTTWEIVKPLDPWWWIWCAIWRSNHCNLVEENWAFSYKLSSSFLWGSLSCATSCSNTTS